ncbi:hypothetical protein BX600DRAFT_529693 [Xylariales sp. PMI_506]|nr:hypothetical protein BX600DRAFT_529693 [Xylariales sp. PMI_506]
MFSKMLTRQKRQFTPIPHHKDSLILLITMCPFIYSLALLAEEVHKEMIDLNCDTKSLQSTASNLELKPNTTKISSTNINSTDSICAKSCLFLSRHKDIPDDIWPSATVVICCNLIMISHQFRRQTSLKYLLRRVQIR